LSAIRNRRISIGPWFLAALLPTLCLLLPATTTRAQDARTAPSPVARVVSDGNGSRLQVDGRDFMIKGMNWDYTPIGENYVYSLWEQPDAFIEDVLAREMPLLRGMGVNVTRQYVGVPPRWVKYMYEKYGIYTVINHPAGRYGFTIDGVWVPSIDYSDPHTREVVIADIVGLVEQFRGVPGMLMWLIGNENNYGLSWKSAEVEALPEGERDAARARHLYSMFGEIFQAIKAHDPYRPVAMANGDVQYIDIIKDECRGLDIFGTNVYRGISARDLFQVVKEKLGVPVLFTEFGADAFNAREMREDQVSQARYLIGQWQEIYEQSSGKGRVGNAIGGLVFQWSDGWWKFGQTERLDLHDTNASWPNGGYVEDFVEGQNNMNEEWWGICAKGPSDSHGLFDLYPRAAYYALQSAFEFDPYAAGMDSTTIRAHFKGIDPTMAALQARGDHASLVGADFEKVRVSGLRLETSTYSTGGDRITTPDEVPDVPQDSPAFLGFDYQGSFFADFEAHPAPNVTGTLSLNVLGKVAENPIDEIFYENRGRPKTITVDGEDFQLNGIERVKVYRSSVYWEEPWFRLNGFYRTGHYHWGDEGDFFGLYRDAYYGNNIDIYNGEAPVGFEVAGRRGIDGLKLAFGPQLWWGANPSVMLKYRRQFGGIDASTVFHEDIAPASTSITSSVAVPVPTTRKLSLQLKTKKGRLGIELGGLWSGSTKIGDEFQTAEPSGDSYTVFIDEVVPTDALGFKGKLTYQKGRWNWYAQGAHMGLVADAGPTAVLNYTGWSLKDTGIGNQDNAMTGVAVGMGKFQLGPNVLWQRPIIGPIPSDVPSPGRPRNVLDDPFAVRGNREMVAGELMLVYDPTPATWFWQWDNDMREDAPLAASLSFVYRHHLTTQDVSIGIASDGRTTFPFPAAPPAQDLWELRGRLVSWIKPDLRLVAHAYGGTAEPIGYNNDPAFVDQFRLLNRYGADVRLAWHQMAFETFFKVNDWGPYDYHRDFNLTFPLQLMGDLSHTLGAPRWFGLPQTRVGIRGTWRSLDKYSNRYSPTGSTVPDLTVEAPDGREWEIRTYLNLVL